MDDEKRPPDAPELAVAKAPDPFSPDQLRLSQDFAEMADVKQVLAAVPVRKPRRHEFVRVHPSEDFHLETAVLELKDDREMYLVTSAVRQELFGELALVRLMTTVNRQGIVSLWPLRLPDETGRTNPWNLSAFVAAQRAKSTWLRVFSDMNLGAYRIFEATGLLPEPEWPNESFRELLDIAFRGKQIADHDDPILKRLRGES
jgi:hypothetical protein